MEGEPRTNEAEAWSVFWQDQGSGSRCLQRASPDITQALVGHWSGFAATLSPATRALDIGCGAGAVARALVVSQRHLHVTGIDLAKIPPSPDPQIRLHSATRMEALPFADAAFGAAVSQFGFEYGRTWEAAKELSRVLKEGAPASLLIHHSGSPIVAANRVRNKALRNLLGESVHRAFMSGDAVALAAQTAMVARQLPGEALIEEAARYLRSMIAADVAQKTAIWTAIAAALLPERVILNALENACVAPDELDAWLAPLRATLNLSAPSSLSRPNGEPIAWRIEGVRERR
jgi:ubiquinone/menaquinone biosynthesis C-methylase UbiE